jgi:hypothetical protein
VQFVLSAWFRTSGLMTRYSYKARFGRRLREVVVGSFPSK